MGFRILAVAVRQDFRPSDFGLRISCFPVLLASALTLPGDTNSLPDLPSSSLRPPRPEILSGFWEQYGGWVVLAVALLLLIITALIWLLVRPKAPVPIAPGTQAREELEPLRQRAEDGAVLSRVSQIVRRYMTTALALPPAELTTTELSGTLLDNRNIGPKLGAEVVDFLRECDLRKFGPFPPQAPLDAVPRALSLIDRTESRIAELNQLTAAQAAGPAAAQPLPPGQKVSSEA